ncbi:MAG: Methylase involved in ubiquinone/menaquinone biosynthesis [Parcubacteria group bacterium GW2011_GWA2_49_9]|nr:MAG: Methylase involved in ubiquinone/menaquinone biosynthesis [Parcubacteria group bacterium GW2011_GWA2_49_9]
MASTERFGYEWDKYASMDERYEAQFRNWTYPLAEDDFKGKKILDAGCGMGRNSFWPLSWGARVAVAFDFDRRSVARAKETLATFPNARVEYKSIYELSWKDEFDIAFSIGVIHHLKEPELALRNLVTALRSGGTLLVWVYSYEGNEWIVSYVNPIRKHITSKLPLPLVHFLSYFCSVPLFILVKLMRGPSKYLKQLSTFRFRHIHSIVFDQLIPEIANYWSKTEVEALGKGIGLSGFDVYAPPNKLGWILCGKK